MIPFAGSPVRARQEPMSPPPGWLFMGPYLVPAARRILVSEIQAKVAAHYQVRLIEMKSARRTRDVARPRQVAMYLARNLTTKSLPEIGRMFGNRDHTTVIHAIRQIERLCDADQELDRSVMALADRLMGAA